jgi:hypothetical protein
MRSKFFFLALIALSFASCRNHDGTANMPETVIDTVNHTKSVDSSGTSTNTGQAPADTAKGKY